MDYGWRSTCGIFFNVFLFDLLDEMSVVSLVWFFFSSMIEVIFYTIY
jgi:hypothetical protein